MRNISRAEFVRQMKPGTELTFRSRPGQSAGRTVIDANAARVRFTTAKGVTTLRFETGDTCHETDTGWAVRSGDLLMEYDRGHPGCEVPGVITVHGNTGVTVLEG